MDTKFEVIDWQKTEDKDLHGCFEIYSMFRTSVHTRVKLFRIKKWSEGRQKLLRVSWRFELSRVWVTEATMEEMHGKSSLVRIYYYIN